MQKLLTFDRRITGRILGRTEALSRLAVHNPALRSHAAQLISAQVDQLSFADASAVSVADAACRTRALVRAVGQIPAPGVFPAGIPETAVPSALPALGPGVADVADGTRAAGLAVDDFALGVETAGPAFETGILAGAVGIAAFVHFAVGVLAAFVRSAGFAGFALVAVRTQTDGSVVGHPAQRVLSASVQRLVGGKEPVRYLRYQGNLVSAYLATVLALVSNAGLASKAIVVRPAARKAQASVADLALGARGQGRTFHPASSVSADFSARTVRFGRARFGAVARLVALAHAVAARSWLCAGNQGVAQVVGRTAALSQVVDHAAACASAAGCGVVTRIWGNSLKL